MKKNLLLSIAGAAFLMACGGSDGVKAPESTTTLTQDQADAVFEALLGDSTSLSAKLRTRAHSEPIGPLDENCPGGGITRTKGEIDVETTDNSIDIAQDVTIQFIDCITREVDGKTITLNGKLSFDGNLSGTGDEDSASFDLKYELVGPLDVTGDDVETGICGVGLLMKADLDVTEVDDDSGDVSITASLVGTICDENINETADVDISL